jgi:hypothetical protein
VHPKVYKVGKYPLLVHINGKRKMRPRFVYTKLASNK